MSDAHSPSASGRQSGEPFVSITDLKKYYDDDRDLIFDDDPVKAVDGVSLDVHRGETVGLVGESGCGKTTLGRTLVQLEDATAGSVEVEGEDVTRLSGQDLRRWQREAGMVFQDPDESLNDRMTVGEIIAEPLQAHDWRTAADREQRVFDLLDEVGLREEHFYRYPHQFSGGQRQRIGIARALALEPEFVVLDEPVSALDVSVQARIINLLEDLQDEFDLTYLFIAHDLSVVRHIADRVAVMYLGTTVERGPTESIFQDPKHPYTTALLSAIPGSFGPDEERITLPGSPPSPRDPPEGCPLSTRCPAKIRADGWDLDGEAWTAIESFRTVLRERARADEPLTDIIRRRLGLDVGVEGIDEITDELFETVDLPAAAREEVRTAADMARRGEDRAAEGHLREQFGSVCDRQHPEAIQVDGRASRCLRHDPEYRDVGAVIEERSDR